MVLLSDIIPEPVILEAFLAYKDNKDASYVADEIIKPSLDYINRKTKQENDTLYLAYLLQYEYGRLNGK